MFACIVLACTAVSNSHRLGLVVHGGRRTFPDFHTWVSVPLPPAAHHRFQPGGPLRATITPMSRGSKRTGIANYEKEVVIGQGNFGVRRRTAAIRACLPTGQHGHRVWIDEHACLVAQVAWKARHKLDGQLYCIKIIPMTAKAGVVSMQPIPCAACMAGCVHALAITAHDIAAGHGCRGRGNGLAGAGPRALAAQLSACLHNEAPSRKGKGLGGMRTTFNLVHKEQGRSPSSTP